MFMKNIYFSKDKMIKTDSELEVWPHGFGIRNEIIFSVHQKNLNGKPFTAYSQKLQRTNEIKITNLITSALSGNQKLCKLNNDVLKK